MCSPSGYDRCSVHNRNGFTSICKSLCHVCIYIYRNIFPLFIFSRSPRRAKSKEKKIVCLYWMILKLMMVKCVRGQTDDEQASKKTTFFVGDFFTCWLNGRRIRNTQFSFVFLSRSFAFYSVKKGRDCIYIVRFNLEHIDSNNPRTFFLLSFPFISYLSLSISMALARGAVVNNAYKRQKRMLVKSETLHIGQVCSKSKNQMLLSWLAHHLCIKCSLCFRVSLCLGRSLIKQRIFL